MAWTNDAGTRGRAGICTWLDYGNSNGYVQPADRGPIFVELEACEQLCSCEAENDDQNDGTGCCQRFHSLQDDHLVEAESYHYKCEEEDSQERN